MTTQFSWKAKFRLSNPWMQNSLSGVCLFLTVGIYHAITGLGAGGGKPSSIQVATTTNAVLYTIFTFVGFFGGSILNTFGPKITYMIGIFGYPFYTTGLWYYDSQGNEWYPLLGGAVLGITAGLLWTAANFIQFAYAEEKKKGSYIAQQLFMVSVGSTVGAAIPFGINFHSTTSGGVPTSVYITFVAIMLSATIVAGLGIISPSKIIRPDGTHIAIFGPKPHFKEEIIGCIKLLKDWRVAVLILPMFATDLTLGLIPTLNAHSCNLRTRSLNNLLYWGIQIPTTLIYGMVLDNDKYVRRTRGLIGLAINVLVSVVGWSIVIGIQLRYSLKRTAFTPKWDWTDSDYSGICTIMIIFGIIFIVNQMYVMWIVGALSNDPKISARCGGFYKAMLSGGLAVAFGLEAAHVSYMNQTIFQIVVMFCGLTMTLFVLLRGIKDSNYFDEDFVIPPKHIMEEQMDRTSSSDIEAEVDITRNIKK